MRFRIALAALLLTIVALASGAPTAATETVPSAASAPVLIEGVDLHDATIRKVGTTYYMYGSMYGCGYEWYVSGTPWCGFGVSTASSLAGPWSKSKTLFDPNSTDPWSKRSWQETCGGTGQGCFNPRMIQRTGWGYNDSVPILWFNAPRHYSDTGANAYNVMGCASLTGPCGPGVQPNGSYTKPNLDICAGNGDFGMIEKPGDYPAIVCTRPGSTELRVQKLNWWGSGGQAGQGASAIATGTVEGPGGWWDETTGQYVVTFSDEGCGYCAGTPTGFAVSPTLLSGWTSPGNVGWGAPAWARRDISSASCGGQPRTVTVLDGQPWQVIDLWVGQRNETTADTLLVPLNYQPSAGTPGDGRPWTPPLSLTCT